MKIEEIIFWGVLEGILIGMLVAAYFSYQKSVRLGFRKPLSWYFKSRKKREDSEKRSIREEHPFL